MKKTMCVCFALLCLLLFFDSRAADTTTVFSPDKQVRFRLFLQREQLMFNIDFRGIHVVETSPLIATLDQNTITNNVVIAGAKNYSLTESYPWWGVHSTAVNEYNGSKILLSQKNFSYTIDVRVFNGGAAYQMVLPAAATSARVPDEQTIFNLPRASTVWYHDLNMHYESVHSKKQAGSLADGEWVAPPATYQLPQGVYAAITEADLKDYPGMALRPNGKSGLEITLAHKQPTSYPYKLRYSAADTQRLMQPAAIAGSITTPWRVVMVGADLNQLVNNDMVHNLCPPPDPALFPQGINTSWIKPGRAVWKYLNGGGDGTLEVMKHFTDGAALLGFEHNILEGFWSRWTDAEIKELVQYSRSKNVDIWFWKHSRNLQKKASRDSFFGKCAELGVRGVKLDFFDHEAKEVVDLYMDILKETAKYQLMVDFHGANKPTGQARTYPNEMIREAVKGMEASKLADRATHETTIPFTRFLAGPAEYTVVHLGARRQNTSWAHQLASAAILSAPVLTYAANPDTLLALPRKTVEIIKSIPATWDETIVLPPSAIGELAVYARRKGSTWFLAIMNGLNFKNVEVPLQFLGDSKYKAQVVKDAMGKTDEVVEESRSATGADVVTLALAAGGGYLCMFEKQ
ncbi:glycoside hydrolase [Segetibacter sp. 3557_3]|uniref:glycoside hydrolase family 97 protein n=1 Tax=Segetibacter sp. 3557_3 TaxID=2547429 RepID=UPI00105859DE|nr:glycoside hydrolase family 97 protein [Segetibacter sp. 3557_3]TDH20067.1 glycoside hydrolase [Segetibacter sp. 3557_3]